MSNCFAAANCDVLKTYLVENKTRSGKHSGDP